MPSDELSGEYVDGLELPDFQIQARYIPTGGAEIYQLVVALALLPFVQAIASTLGTKVGKAIDDATRRAVGRLLRRIRDRAEAVDPPPINNRGAHEFSRFELRIVLTIPGRDIVVEMAEALPAEAVAQLTRMTVDQLEMGYGTIFWSPAGDPAGRWHAVSGFEVRSVWDDAAGQWVRPDDR